MNELLDVKDMTNCSICFDIYNDAITLYCGHSFCKDCIFY